MPTLRDPRSAWGGPAAFHRAALDDIRTIEDQVQAYLMVAVNHADDRSDMLHDAVCDAWITLTIEGDSEAARVHGMGTARRLAASWKRRQRAELPDGCIGDASRASAPGEVERTYRLALWEYDETVLLRHLTEAQRAALELHVMDGLSDQAISDLSKSPRNAIRVLRRAAKRRLRLLADAGLIPPSPDDVR